MRKLLTCTIVAIAVSGCVSVPQPTGSLHSEKPVDALSRELLDLAETCWQRKPTFWKDGVIIRNRVELTGPVITAFRRGPGIPDQPEFMIVSITSSPEGGSMVATKEGSYATSNLDLTSDVRRWVAGDATCRTQQ